MLRVPLYPAKSSFSFSPGCQGLFPPSIHRGFGALDVAADPGFQNEVHHAAVPPAAAGQGLYVVFEIVLAAEFQKRKTVLRKRDRLALQFGGHARIVEDRVPHQIRHEHFQQRCAVAIAPLRLERKLTEPENGFSANGRNTGPRFCCAAASAVVNSRKVCDPVPDER